MSDRQDDRRFPNRPILGASIAVLRGNEVLLAKRGNPPLKDLWSLPGGMVEIGETVAQAALRELAEETGVSAKVVGTTGYLDIIGRNNEGRVERHYVVLTLAARHTSGEPVAGEDAQEVRWVRLDELESLPLTDGAVDIIREAALIAAPEPVTSSEESR